MSDDPTQTREERLSDLFSRIAVSGPDAEGLMWLTIRGGTVCASVSTPANSIQGQAFAEFKAMRDELFRPKLVRRNTA